MVAAAQARIGRARVGCREGGVAGHRRRTQCAAERMVPALRHSRAGIDQRMADRRGGDERMRHHATKQVGRCAHAQLLRLCGGQGVAQHAETALYRAGILQPQAHQPRYFGGDPGMRRGLVPAGLSMRTLQRRT